jgi:hypothetical protein
MIRRSASTTVPAVLTASILPREASVPDWNVF